MFTDERWNKLKTVLLSLGIYDKATLRQTVERIVYRLRIGCPWRDLPAAFGKWNAVYKRFNAWSLQEKFMKLFQNLIVEPDLEWVFIDGSIVKSHQHSSGASYEQETVIGKSVAGNTTKIHMAVNAGGLPPPFSVTGGKVHDCKEAPELVAKLLSAKYIIADKGYGSEPLRMQIRDQGAVPVIPRKQNSTIGNDEMNWWAPRKTSFSKTQTQANQWVRSRISLKYRVFRGALVSLQISPPR
ncbi:IS5 family transposase [Methylomicrobium sp. Wu6]|uniref:IS5 family transposase n=1 Tax=Methylomicrobium sp. Wu6 TaxID=3107928 RepID=UPI002DD67284|nr:IS5 family transposase [Methylomicrobium sp. Wu6]MEC4748247.1 IS5 family transposase [Methylomicrobium sp. Wu6]